MNYIGSKHKLLNFIKNAIYEVVGKNLSDKILCDIFAGTGVVGRSFKCEVKKVIANDCQYYSYVLNKNYIENHFEIKNKEQYINDLNALPLITDGFIYQNYCIGGNGQRQYFSDFNGKKIDIVRTKIEQWKEANKISSNLYFFLLASLLECADKVANTASVYGAYLKNLKKSAQKELILQSANYEISQNKHEVFYADSNDLIKKISGDILYLDPPYNARQYGANYHILNTIAKYDNFVPKGKTGLRRYEKSKYCNKNMVQNELENLIKNANFKYIFLSYNNEGLMSVSQIRAILEKYGQYDLQTIDYQRFKADKTENRNHKADFTNEYLHVLEKK